MRFKSKKAQTIIELSVFGAILIFIIGVIIRQALSFSYIQNQSLKAMRLALSLSYEYSEGYRTLTGISNSYQGTASRNSATILLVEDRLTAESLKYGNLKRNPYLNQGTGTYSRTLYMPIDPGETWNLPVFDMIVNGKHFVFTVADFRETPLFDISGLLITDRYYTVVPNKPSEPHWCDTEPCPDGDGDGVPDGIPAVDRFELNRCWDPQMAACMAFLGATCTPNPVDRSDWETFGWQWNVVELEDIEVDPDSHKTEDPVSIDVDCDFREERLLVKHIDKMILIDNQEGDMDFTLGDDASKAHPGIQRDVFMYTQTRDGTYFRIEEGKLFGAVSGQFIRTTSKKDSVDLIQREILLSKDTGRYCQGGTPNMDPSAWPDPKIPNPVEVCGNCFSAGNIDKTCFDPGVPGDPKQPPYILVRSRVKDFHGRSWVTDIGSDPQIKITR